MKLFAQHGYGPGDKILNGIQEGSISGVILSARYQKKEKLNSDIENIINISNNAEILMDPEIYACICANMPDSQLGQLVDWDFFRPHRRAQLEDTSNIDGVLGATFTTMAGFPLTSIIAPNIFIPRSFNSIEAVIAKNFIRRTMPVFAQTGDTRHVFATLAIGHHALLDRDEFGAFLNDITALDNPPDGFYVLIGGGMADERTDITRSEIMHADVIAGWMLLNFTLKMNGFKVINGCSDILTPLLGGVGGYAGATGWWTNLRMFSMNKYIRTASGGRQPVVRYLSNIILNRIKFSEREAIAALIPEINNGLAHDSDYESGEPERRVEVLQTWESIKNLNEHLIGSNVEESIRRLENAIKRADATYTRLSGFGLPLDIETNREYITSLREGLKTFKQIAEI
ncbi:MAG: hypothetical protein FJ119_00910 [Deltaproteobacteria bacterium]|nr:hypothetical protein [Deltaproteobacteria bacterium]